MLPKKQILPWVASFVVKVSLCKFKVSILMSCFNVYFLLSSFFHFSFQSVFSPYLSDHVKRCLVRNQTIFGVLIPSGNLKIGLSCFSFHLVKLVNFTSRDKFTVSKKTFFNSFH
jgi:hypothetical protein